MRKVILVSSLLFQVVISFSGLLAEPDIEFARAPKRCIKPTVKAITKQANGLLKNARNTLTSYRNRYEDIRSSNGDRRETERLLTESRRAADLTNDENLETLQEELAERFDLSVSQKIIEPAMRSHRNFSEAAKRNRIQAGLNDVSPVPTGTFFIGGLTSFKRRAMGNVVKSSEREVELINDVFNVIRSNFNQTITEFNSLSQGRSQHLLQFGYEHYLDSKEGEMKSLITLLESVQPLFAGVDLDGNLEQPTLCLSEELVPGGQAIPTFAEFMGLVIRIIDDHGVEEYDAFKDVLKTRILEEYDGREQNPGFKSHWRACISTVRLQRQIREEFRDNAITDGNFDSAAVHDRVVRELIAEELQYEGQREVIDTFRDILRDIEGAMSAQDKEDNYDSPFIEDQEAWQRTGVQHALNHIESFRSYTPALIAMRTVVEAALVEIGPLRGITDELDRQTAFKTQRATLQSIQENGVERFRRELTAADNALNIASRQAVSGEVSLLRVLNEYQDTITDQADGLERELNALPSLITRNNTDVADAEVHVADSERFVRVVFDLEKEFDAANEMINKNLDRLRDTFAKRTFHPAYTYLTDQLTETLSGTGGFNKGFAKQLNKAFVDLLTKFSTFNSENLSTSAVKISAQRRGKKGCKAFKRKFIRAAKKRRKEIQANIGGAIDDGVRPTLGGRNLSQLLNEIGDGQNRINGIQNRLQ